MLFFFYWGDSIKSKFCVRCGRIVKNGECACSKRKELTITKEKQKEDCKNGIHSVRWRKKRVYIIKRDKGLCQRCLIKYNILNGSNLSVHHIKPRIDYPELMYEDDNLITLCMTCNLQLGTTGELDFDYTSSFDDFNL